MNTKKRDWIEYEQIVAGALLKFEEIDFVLYNLIIDDFENKMSKEVNGLFEYTYDNIGKYLETVNGVIKFKNDIVFDSNIRKEFSEFAGELVNSYFNSLNIDKFKAMKEKLLLENKKRVLEEANVLLISDIEDDYEKIVEYGFKNVNYFKSIVRANKFFLNKQEELEKYHIILTGHQSVQPYGVDAIELDNMIYRVKQKENILATNLYRYDYSDHTDFVTYLYDRRHNRYFNIHEGAYTSIFDKIVETIFINRTLEKSGLNSKEFVKYVDYINPNRLPLPTKKEELKILYLGSKFDYIDKVSKKLELNVEFKKDNNYCLKSIRSNLGDYDIIIATKQFSSHLLNMNRESTEQCKDTGRELTLFVTWEDSFYIPNNKLGNDGSFSYSFGGNLAPDLECYNKKINVLRQSVELGEKDEYWEENGQMGYSTSKAILESSVNIYNQALIQNNKPVLNNLDFKTAEEINQEYMDAYEQKIKAYEQKEAKRKEELKPIKSFDNIRLAVAEYIEYRQKGLVKDKLNGIIITEGKEGIKVDNTYGDRVICSIIFSKKSNGEHFRILDIQTVSKKGFLTSPKTIGLYTSELEGFSSILTKPDEKQLSALYSIEKKLNNALKEAKQNLSEQKKKVLGGGNRKNWYKKRQN